MNVPPDPLAIVPLPGAEGHSGQQASNPQLHTEATQQLV
jgi:hypothetical protein